MEMTLTLWSQGHMKLWHTHIDTHPHFNWENKLLLQMTLSKGMRWILNDPNVTFMDLHRSCKESVNPFYRVDPSEMTCPTQRVSAGLLPEKGALQTARAPLWRKGPCPGKGTLRLQRWPGGSHLGPPTPLEWLQDSCFDPFVLLTASRVAFSATGFPNAECLRAVLLGNICCNIPSGLRASPQRPWYKTCLFGSYKCPQSLWSGLSVSQHQWM